MKRSLLLVLACVALVAATTPARAAGELLRIPATFPFDVNVVERPWLEGMIEFATLPNSSTVPKAQDLRFNFTGAIAPGRNFELGANFGFISRNYDNDIFGSPNGVSDTMLWGKYALSQAPAGGLSVGAFLSLPTGNENDGFGTGTTDPGLFVSGGVQTSGKAFVQGHVGLRFNGDYKVTRAGLTGELSGKTSILIGFGGIVPVSSGMEAFGSFALETERYDGSDSFAQIAVGGRWAIAPTWRLQAQAGIGLAEAAPDLSLAFGVVFTP